ncbi:MAG: LCP family protein [Traorella sp.]
MKKKKVLLLNRLFSIVFIVIMIAFLVQLYLLDKLPIKYYILMVTGLSILTAVLVLIQILKRFNKVVKTFGEFLMLFIGILLVMGIIYINKTNDTIKKFTENTNKKDIAISVIVMNDSPLHSIQEITGDVGIVNIGETVYIDEALAEMNKINFDFETKVYAGFDRFGDALYNGEVEAIVLNESLRSQFEDNHPTFDEDTRVITTYYYEKVNDDISIDVDVTKEVFTVYITGIDQKGSINTNGRSDVNKVLVINPTTHQIFIIDIPRDYYIEQVCQFNQKDKLTHTGIFGVDCSVKSVSNYMGIDINYYIRINFSSLEKIVDALGGIEVDSEYEFSAGGYTFTKGINYLNGSQALAFSRERKSFAAGDNIRIANQTRVLKAMINKAISPSIITNYLSFLEAIEGSFQTNMSENEINDLIKMQLNDMKEWNIVSDALTGKGGTDWTPANGFNAYVMYPDETSLERILGKIWLIKENKVIE